MPHQTQAFGNAHARHSEIHQKDIHVIAEVGALQFQAVTKGGYHLERVVLREHAAQSQQNSRVVIQDRDLDVLARGELSPL